MADHEAKQALFDGLVVAAKALANGRRAEIVDLLSQGERSVEEIAAEIGQSTANTSQHLQQLLRAGLVTTRRDGNRIYYQLAGPRVGELWMLLRDVTAEHHAEVERLAAAYLGDRGRLTTITRAELARRLGRRDVVVVDVRPEAEYAAGHIAGAVSLPIDQLTGSSFDVPKHADVVAYCRGPYCVYADEAVRALGRKGWKAVRLEDGYPEWERAGLPVATGPSVPGGGSAR